MGVTDQAFLLEREAELEELDRALAATLAGEGRLLAIEGPAGIGKTRVLEACRHAAAERGLRTLTARAGELERDFAYGIVRQLFERVVAGASEEERAGLLAGAAAHAGAALGLDAPDVARVGDDASFAVRHGLYWLVANVAAQGPVLIAVDDVQWSDAPSLRYLAYLARRLDGLPVLLAVTVRTGEPSADEALLAELAAATAAPVRPAPLSLAATGELLGADRDFAAACHAATGGNPFLLRELATALAADGIAPEAANAERVSVLGPRTVARALVLRLGRVSPAAVAFARAVAVLGATADPRLAAGLAGIDEDGAREAVDALSRTGVLVGERPLRFSHPILREAVYREIPPAERDAMHLTAAKSLRALGAPASEVAAHLLATVPLGDQRTVRALRDAAREALAQGAGDLAARYLQRALTEPPEPAERPALVAELGKATWLAGEDLVGAVAHLREALDATTELAARPTLAIDLARATFSIGDVPGAAGVIEAELARGHARDDELVLEAEFGSIHLLHQGTFEFGERLQAFASLPGDTLPEMLVLTNVAVWEWMRGTAARCEELAERALGGGRATEAGSDSIAVMQAAWVLAFCERGDLATHTLETMLADARRTGSVFGITGNHTLLALVAYHRGDIRATEATTREAIDLPGLPPFVHPTIHTYLTLALVERGELDEAEAVIDRSWVGPYLPLIVHMTYAFYARGLLRAAQGRFEDARDDLFEVGDRQDRLLIANPGFPWRVAAARALLALEDVEGARRLVREHAVDADRWGTPGAVGLARAAEGLVDRDAALLEAGIELLARSDRRLDHAKALVDLGVVQRVAGERRAAQDALREGLDRARRCGATALVRRAHEELVAAGAKPRRLQFSGVESLTASERRVCELAADGATNRDIAQELFVTPKTVENHLGRAYGKLGISSRDQLAGALGDTQAKDEGPPLMT